jgi:hypothetical protein
MSEHQLPAILSVQFSSTRARTPTGNNLKVLFASQHLIAAALFARQAWQVEDAGPASAADTVAYQSYSIGAILSSVAFVECSINELFSEAKDADPEIFASTPPDLASRMVAEWKKIDRAGPLAKHAKVLELAGAEPFQKDANPWLGMDNLMALRNSLVHFSPEWVSDMPRLASLEQRLSGLFSLSPYVPEYVPTVPYKCLSAGAAVWAVRTAREFVEAFAGKLTMPLELGRYGALLELPAV